MKNFIITLAALWLFALAGCNSPQQILIDKTVPYANCQTGDTVQIALAENPTTGYVWQLGDLDGKIVRLESQQYQQSATSPNLCGAGGTKIFTFAIVGKGRCQVAAQLMRPWEKKPIETRVFSIDAK